MIETPVRAYRIKELSQASTFELGFDNPLSAILDDLGKFNGFSESGGIIELTEDDLNEMEETLKGRTGNYDEEGVKSVEQTIARIRQELDPKYRYVIYYCY